MQTSGVKVVVFDWDGTLVDSEKHIVSSIKYAAEQVGLPVLSYDRMKSIIGLGMREALFDLYPAITEEELQALRQFYASQFFSERTEATNLFSGVENTLAALLDDDIRLAVATGKSRRGLELAKASTGLGRFFEIERCADETASKPDPLMLHELQEYFAVQSSEMLMVGDTVFDMEMAHRASVPAVGVSYGVHGVEDILQWDPVAVVDDLPELLGLINSK